MDTKALHKVDPPAGRDRVTGPAPWTTILELVSLRSLRSRTALLLGAALLPMGLMALQAGLNSALLAERATQTDVATRVQAEIAERQKDVSRMRDVTRALAVNSGFALDDVAQCNAAMSNVGAEFRDLAIVSILDSGSRVVCASQPETVGATASTAGLIDNAKRLGDVATAYLPASRVTAGPVIATAAPVVRTGRTMFVTVMRASAPLLAIGSERRGEFAALATGDGRILQANGLGATEARALARVLSEQPPHVRSGPFKVGESLWATTASLAEADIYLVAGWRRLPLDVGGVLSVIWAISAPALLLLAGVVAAWLAVELYIVRPLTAVEMLGRAYARGEDTSTPESFRNAPVEIASLRRTLAAMAKTMRGRESRLSEALQEERALLRELHHRVNNNLQMVASLLAIQARATPDAQQAVGLVRAHERIQLLALAHKQIYGSGQVRDVNLDQLTCEIVSTLFAARGAAVGHIRLNMMLEPACAPVDHAVALAFLIGESVSQAFDLLADADRATLDVVLRREGENVIFVTSSPDQTVRNPVRATARRIIDAFARQIGVLVTYDRDDPLTVRLSMTVGVAAPDSAPAIVPVSNSI